MPVDQAHLRFDDELERARFLLRHLYPDLEGQRLDAIMARLEAEWAAGTWHGFRRPGSEPGSIGTPDVRGGVTTPPTG